MVPETLRCMGPDQRMKNWMQAIYSRPMAQVKVNGLLSSSYGMRQGCPLSPLIFILTLEPFLRSVRENPNITSLRLEGTLSLKITAFADDILFFVSNPLVTVPNLLQELKTYGVLTYFKINYFEIGGAEHLHV